MSVGGAKVVRSGWWRVRGRRGDHLAAAFVNTILSIKRKEHLEECADDHDVVQGKGNHAEEG